METMVNILAIGGCVSVFTTPVALWALIGTGRTCQKLEERNAAQGVTISGLQARLERGAPAGVAGKARQKRVVDMTPIEYRMWREAGGIETDGLEIRQIRPVEREVGPEAGGSTSTPPIGAVRPVSDEGGQ